MDAVVKKDKLVLEVSEKEVLLLNNALNEVCNGPGAIEEWEFHIRTGVDLGEARVLLNELADLLDRLTKT